MGREWDIELGGQELQVHSLTWFCVRTDNSVPHSTTAWFVEQVWIETVTQSGFYSTEYDIGTFCRKTDEQTTTNRSRIYYLGAGQR